MKKVHFMGIMVLRQTSIINVHLGRGKLFTHTFKTQNSSMDDYWKASSLLAGQMIAGNLDSVVNKK